MIAVFDFNASASAHAPESPMPLSACVIVVFHCSTNRAILVVVAHIAGPAL